MKIAPKRRKHSSTKQKKFYEGLSGGGQIRPGGKDFRHMDSVTWLV